MHLVIHSPDGEFHIDGEESSLPGDADPLFRSNLEKIAQLPPLKNQNRQYHSLPIAYRMVFFNGKSTYSVSDHVISEDGAGEFHSCIGSKRYTANELSKL
jgi:hypothetical protein